MTPALVPIQRFVDGLVAIAHGPLDFSQVKRYVEENPVDPETLSRYLFFRRNHYTRNLIHRCAHFELMTICWETGQGSAIHNHQGQNCWMTVPIGRLRVRNYRLLSLDEAARRCKIELSEELIMDPAHPAAVDPAEPIHSVVNPFDFHERAASLHVYSLPYTSCITYSPERGTYQEVPLHYTSEHGVLCE